jgi:hypothetical protein
MSKILTNRQPSRCAWILSLFVGLVVHCGAIEAQVTQLYSFEADDFDGFTANGGGLTVSQEASGLGATSGTKSLKLEYADFSSFAGPNTNTIPAAFNDPLGIDFVRFDLTNTNRFVPPTPQPGVTPTFANIGLNFFGDLPGNPVQPAHLQFLLSEVAVGPFEPGTHEVEIDVSNTGSPTGTGGGLNVDTGQVKGYDAWVAAGFVPSGFGLYLNKNGKFGDPTFAWTVYIDNVRVGRTPAGVLGDYNGNGTVDAADYALWRNGGPLLNEVVDVGTVSAGDYTEWRTRFGNTSGSGSGSAAVPEPMAAALVLVAMTCCLTGRLRRNSC